MRNVSVLAVFVRSSLYKVLLIIMLMVSVEGFKFYKFLGSSQETLMNAEQMFDKLNITDYFMLALVVVFLMLCVTENRLEKSSGNTFMRLRVSSKELFVIKTLYNVCVIALLFVVQIWISIIITNVYIGHIGEDTLGTQQLFLVFYRSEALHNILPMAEAGKWIRNILLVAAYAMQAAECGKKNHVIDIWIGIVLLMFMESPIGLNLVDMFADLITVIVIATALLKTFGAFSDDERE